jgi:DNA-binding NtrC family response regulator
MRSLRVLVVDDDPSVRRVLERALELRGHEPLLAARGEAAIELLRSHEVDVVLMDLRMPSMSGKTLFHVIASQWPQLATRTVIMSGDPDSRDHEEWLSLNNLPVINKPFELSDLFALIERLLTDERRQANGS